MGWQRRRALDRARIAEEARIRASMPWHKRYDWVMVFALGLFVASVVVAIARTL